MPTLRARDDRGRRVRLPVRFALEALRAWKEDLGEVSWRRVPRVLVRAIVSPVGLAFLGAGFIVGAILKLVYEDFSMALGLMVFTPVVVPMLTLGFLTARGVLGIGGSIAGDIEEAMLRRRKCPCCGYALAGSEPAHDGCVVCAECGAAWDGRRIERAATRRPDVVVIRGFGREA